MTNLYFQHWQTFVHLTVMTEDTGKLILIVQLMINTAVGIHLPDTAVTMQLWKLTRKTRRTSTSAQSHPYGCFSKYELSLRM